MTTYRNVVLTLAKPATEKSVFYEKASLALSRVSDHECTCKAFLWQPITTLLTPENMQLIIFSSVLSLMRFQRSSSLKCAASRGIFVMSYTCPPQIRQSCQCKLQYTLHLIHKQNSKPIKHMPTNQPTYQPTNQANKSLSTVVVRFCGAHRSDL